MESYTELLISQQTVTHNLGKEMDGDNPAGISHDEFNTEAMIKKGEHFAKTYLHFDFDHNPFWKRTSEEVKSIEDMLSDIIDYKRSTCNANDKIKDRIIKEMQDRFIFQMSRDEEVGVQTEEETCAVSRLKKSTILEEFHKQNMGNGKAKLETKNMYRTLKYLNSFMESKGKYEEQCLTSDIILRAHKTLMEYLHETPGELSNNVRKTMCPDSKEEHFYPSPEFVREIFPRFLDVSNYMALYFNFRRLHEDYSLDFLKMVFKFCAWFFFNFISLHPFGDGNGRMARLLYCYIQFMVSPFPVGIYNIFAPTSKNDYLEAIVMARKRLFKILNETKSTWQREGWNFESEPKELATMILECQWHTWTEYKSILDSMVLPCEIYQSEFEDLSTPSL